MTRIQVPHHLAFRRKAGAANADRVAVAKSMTAVEGYRVCVGLEDRQTNPRCSPLCGPGLDCCKKRIPDALAASEGSDPHRDELDCSVFRRGRTHHAGRSAVEVTHDVERNGRKPRTPSCFRVTFALPICQL